MQPLKYVNKQLRKCKQRIVNKKLIYKPLCKGLVLCFFQQVDFENQGQFQFLGLHPHTLQPDLFSKNWQKLTYLSENSPFHSFLPHGFCSLTKYKCFFSLKIKKLTKVIYVELEGCVSHCEDQQFFYHCTSFIENSVKLRQSTLISCFLNKNFVKSTSILKKLLRIVFTKYFYEFVSSHAFNCIAMHCAL